MLWILTDVGWRDGVDIFLLGALLYALYVIVGRTRAALFIPLAVVVAATLAATNIFDLILSFRFLMAFAAGGAIIVLLLYKEEFREFLFSLGSARHSLLGSREPLGFPLQHLALEVFKLAQNRVGAIIVFERAEDLAFHLQNGTRLEGYFAPEIVPAIFQPASPIHDGAMVIRDGRILWVGTYLPLTHRPDLPKTYGSRHRAAIGLTERSDGVALVVSEERGSVSLVVGGEAEVIPDASTLADKLRELLAPSWPGQGVRPAVGVLRSIFVTHVRPKLLFLGLAFIVWLVVMSPVGVRIVDNIPVVVEGLLPDYVVVVEPRTVSLTLRGSMVQLDQYLLDSIEIELPGGRLLEGEYRFPVVPYVYRLPAHVDPVDASPSSIRLRVEPVSSKNLRVRIQWIGRISSRADISSVEVYPPMVRVVGSASRLAKVSSILTGPVSFEQLTSSGIVETPLLVPEGLRLGKNQSAWVDVIVR